MSFQAFFPDNYNVQVYSRNHVSAPAFFSSDSADCGCSRYSGAGLSGLALAISLQRFAPDVDFEIYEGAAELAEIGAGIGLAPRTWAMVQALGIEDALLKISGDGDRPSAWNTRTYRRNLDLHAKSGSDFARASQVRPRGGS